jgi:hypothetical protein
MENTSVILLTFLEVSVFCFRNYGLFRLKYVNLQNETFLLIGDQRLAVSHHSNSNAWKRESLQNVHICPTLDDAGSSKSF